MSVIEASAISIGCHEKGILLSVLAGSVVAANIRLSDDLARQLDSALRRAREAQRMLEQKARGDER
jgi:hypothetical protein